MHSTVTSPDVVSGILLVEGVDAMRLYLRLTLERAGFEVIETSTLREAREFLRKGHRPRSVVLDLELPDGHGLDLIRELPTGVPVLVLSADDSSETRLRCRQAGCTDVLDKSKQLSGLGQIMMDIENVSSSASEPIRQEPELARQYNQFLTETRIDLQRANERHDFDRVRLIAHRLRGTAIHFGYSGISASASKMGQSIASGDIDRIESSLGGLIDQLLEATDSYRAT